ncbi:AraC family transcriptional regulator [Blautia sp. HCP3S3_G3]|uniref:AraC family transcriptional regulator n=1 Tax=Blautia sp. HCP3S3_G3 TaxID=3438913 RepID=UPI003F8B4020
MIKNLTGIHETVDYRTDTQICLYYNDEYENYPPHWHTSFEIIMPTVNSYRVVCGEKDYHLREKDILVICPCMIHELFAPETGERIIFQPGLNKISIKELNLLTSIISPALLITPEEYPLIHERVHQLMLDIKEEYFNASHYAEAAIFSKFLEILVCIGRSHKTFTQKQKDLTSSRQKEYVEKFIFITDYINEHFAENLTLEDAANLAGFSKFHFSRLFKQYTDTSFYKYLNQKRIAYAKTLLLDPQMAVTDVALQSGFSSLSAFLRMFKQMNQCTPTEFRNMYDN